MSVDVFNLTFSRAAEDFIQALLGFHPSGLGFHRGYATISLHRGNAAVLSSFLESLVCELIEGLDEVYLARIVGAQCAGAEEVVLPLGEVVVNVLFGIVVVLPEHLPRLVGLRFANNEAPAIAADALHKEDGVDVLNVVVVDTVHPLCANERAAIALQLVYGHTHLVKLAVAMEVNEIRELYRAPLLLKLNAAVDNAAPDIGGNGLHGIALAH